MIQHIATYRVVFGADDEVDGKIIAEHIREEIEKELELDEGDSADLTQVTIYPESLTAQETADIMRLARNALLRMKLVWAYDLARELDKAAFMLSERREKDSDLTGYDWSKFISVASDVLKGKMPID